MKKSDPIERIDITGFHDDPNKIKDLNYPEIAILCRDLRRAIISACSTYGGHLSSNLGVVELTVALFRVFDFPKDKLILDVGHQSYAYKLLSGRSLEGLNTPGHTSGFQKRSEGEFGRTTLHRFLLAPDGELLTFHRIHKAEPPHCHGTFAFALCNRCCTRCGGFKSRY